MELTTKKQEKQIIQPVTEEELTREELEFTVVKMRSATYRGDEFEQFYSVLSKITKYLSMLP